MNFPEGQRWFREASEALTHARREGWAIYDQNSSVRGERGQVFDTVAVDGSCGVRVYMLTADVRLSGRPRWWWVELVECDHADHRFTPYPKARS